MEQKEGLNELKLYSISEAARVLTISRDSVKKLIAEGKVGYIPIGRSKKISHQELLRFQKENAIHTVTPGNEEIISNINFTNKRRQKKDSLKGADILNKLLKEG